MTRSKGQRFESVWDAIEGNPAEAANMKIRSELMRMIGRTIEKRQWTQASVAEQCGVSQPRINDLMRGKISKFSIDALVNIATRLGCRVHMALKAA